MSPSTDEVVLYHYLWQRFRLNILGYGYSQIVTLATQFLTVPFFLSYWGSERYAEWLALSGIPLTLSLLDFGVAQASATKSTILAAQNDIVGVRRSLQTAMLYSTAVALVIILTICIAGYILDWTKLLNLPTLSEEKAQTVLLLLTGYLGITLMGGPINAWFMAMDRTATGFFLLANRRMLDVVFTVIALTLKANAPQLALIMFCEQSLLLFLIVIFAKKNSPWQVLGVRNASITELRSILKPGAGHICISIGQTITLQGGIQFLNQTAPASIVVPYSMSRTLMRIILQTGVVISHAARPELSRLIANRENKIANSLLIRISAVSILSSSTIYVILVSTGPWIMNFWSDGKVIVTHYQLALIGIHTLLNIVWTVPSTILFATNRHGRLALVYACGSAIGILACIILNKCINSFIIGSIALLIPDLIAAVMLLTSKKINDYK